MWQAPSEKICLNQVIFEGLGHQRPPEVYSSEREKTSKPHKSAIWNIEMNLRYAFIEGYLYREKEEGVECFFLQCT